jgi:ParB-like chromosome segregation protein Spo0J
MNRKRRGPPTIKDLRPAPYNPREIGPESLEALGGSLAEFGDISGLVWNRRTGRLVAGHQRLEALKKQHGGRLRMAAGAVLAPDGGRFPVRVVDWPEAKEKAANIAANSPLLAGEFTADLGPLLDEINLELPDLSEALMLGDLAVHETAATQLPETFEHYDVLVSCDDEETCEKFYEDTRKKGMKCRILRS